MKKYFLLLLIATQLSTAQNSKEIIGKWAFVSLQDDGQSDEQTKELTNMIFKDLTISFREDHTMSIQLKKKPEAGTYSFDKSDDKIINAVSSSGKPMKLSIIKLTKDELTINMDKGGVFNLKKTSATPDAAIAETPKVPATAKQITGKWYVVGSDGKKLSEFTSELTKDSFVTFGADGKYSAKILSIEQNGTWDFGPGNTTIVVNHNDGKGVWSIYQVSDNDLLMQNDTSSKQIMFSRTQPK